MPTTTQRNTFSETTHFAEPGEIEKSLMRLAAQVYQQTFEGLDGGSLTFESVGQLGLSPQLQKLVTDAEQASLGVARRNMSAQFSEIQDQIAGDLAGRGILDSSTFGVAQGRAGAEFGRQFANVADQARGQASQQLFSGAFQQQQNQTQLLGMLNQLKLAGTSPQLLRDLMQFRLATAGRSGSSKTTTKTPFDPTALAGGLGAAYGGWLGRPQTPAKADSTG